MKGPDNRKRFLVKRVWQCPRCGVKEWTAGDVVQRVCTQCGGPNPTFMKLVEDLPRPRTPSGPPLDLGASPSDATNTP
jgi:hypothetical protein